MNGIIFNIQKFCVNDGPGIRTTVFLKGCPLKCVWCHNPESQEPTAGLMFYQDKCVSCGRCVGLCKEGCHRLSDGIHVFDREKCVKCFACVEVNCGALEKVGRSISSEEVMKEILKDKIFYDNSGGGLTLSGGEPLSQFDFSMDILKKAKEHGLHTAMETCGFAPTDKMAQIAEYVDLFLYDYKETDSRLHREYTGVDNTVIMDNLALLDYMGKDIILRCPIIPGYNDGNHFDGICAVANRFDHILHVEIEPYHALGESKYAALGRSKSRILTPDEEEKNRWLAEIAKNSRKEVKFA